MVLTRAHSSLLHLLLLATYQHHQILASQPVELGNNSDGLCFKFRVHIIDALSSNEKPLYLKCWSLDDDLGDHHLYIGGDFTFKFGLKFFGKTLFTCYFQWGNKDQHVDVFDDKVEAISCCDTRTCFWRAQDDGIYFSVNAQFWEKRFNWTIS